MTSGCTARHWPASTSPTCASASRRRFAAVWRGEIENDRFNRLVLCAGLRGREATVIRAYVKYLRQVGATFSRDFMVATIVGNPEIASLLVSLFAIRFDPGFDRHADRGLLAEQAVADIEGRIDQVASLERGPRAAQPPAARDRHPAHQLLSSLHAEDGGIPRLALKLDPRAIPDLPRPRPMFEIFVYSPRVEGVHLRGGPVARGGLRWSDRPEDFRTEILGLVKAQTVKNAVIVPVGAKGGFVVKAAPRRPGRALRRGRVLLPDVRARAARRHRQHGRRHGRAAAARGAPRRRRPLPRRRRRQGHRDVLRHGQRDLRRVRVLARRRLRLRRVDGLRPQGDGDHRPRRVGVGPTALPGASASTSRTRTSRWSGVGDMSGDVFGNGMLLSRPHPAGRRLRPPPRLPRPEPRCCPRLRGAVAAVRAAALVAGPTTTPRRSPPAAACSPGRPSRVPLSDEVRGPLDVDAEALTPAELDPRDPAGAGRPALERRHRHLRQGDDRDQRRRRRQDQRRGPGRRRPTCAAGSWARAATSVSPSAGGSSSRTVAG